MKKIYLALLFLICLLALTACSSKAMEPLSFGLFDSKSSAPASPAPPAAMYDSADFVAYEYEVASTVAEPQESGGGGYGGGSGLPVGVEARKVVTSAEFRVLTEDFNASMRRLEQKIAVSGSYIQQSDSRAATEYRAAYASMTIRVPATLYGDFKTFLTDLAELDSASEHGDDVTVQYYDTEARLKVLQAQEERIKTFIANSKDLDEIFKIERELTRISTEIEQLTTVKNRLDNLTAYATVYVEVLEIQEIPEEEVEEPETFGERVAKAFSGAVGAVVIAVQLLVLLLVWIWPLLVLAGIVLLVLRKVSKRRAKAAGKNLPLPAPDEGEKEEQKKKKEK